MSGRNNIVPMPTAAAPAPMAYPWPMPPGGFPAGCCPPGGMDALMQCYCDIQAATAFISKVVQDLAANDPAFQQSLVDAIAASGSNIPLIGVTNGSDAQPGQVGEFIHFTNTFTFGAAYATQPLTAGVLAAGDWDIWAYCGYNTRVSVGQFVLNPVPPGMSDVLSAIIATGTSSADVSAVNVVSPVNRGSFTAPTLMAFTMTTEDSGGTGGSGFMNVCARRIR